MTSFEIITILISILALIGSIISGTISIKQKKLNNGSVEMQIQNMIFQSEQQLINFAMNGTDEQKKSAFKSAMSMHLNAYDEACAKYLDNKVDKARFKINYANDIKNIVESTKHASYFNPAHTSRYQAILKVYKEWNDLENK